MVLTPGLLRRATSAGGLWPNKPAHLTAQLFDTNFSTFPTADGWNKGGDLATIVSDATAPISPTDTVIQWEYNSSLPGGVGPGLVYNDNFLYTYSEYYVGFYIKWSANWNTGNGRKIWYPFDSQVSMAFDISSETGHFGFHYSGLSVDPLTENMSTTDLSLDTWHLVEQYIKPGASNNGIVRVWADNVLRMDRTNVQFATATPNWEEWRFSNTWLFNEATTQYMWVDHCHLVSI